jgi:RNA-directed DNA polymerase
VELYARVKSRRVLLRAWAAVKASGLASASSETNRQIKTFDQRFVTHVERIAYRLRAKTFSFEGEKGIAPAKGGGKAGRRPIVLAPIENRIVRRAILDVLQGFGEQTDKARDKWKGVEAVRRVLATTTSVGGIRNRGVPHGLALISDAVERGHCWFVRSDIRDFFTRISIESVDAFMRDAITDSDFLGLFRAALATNLVNRDELEERHLFTLFPNAEIGVAQGSALSALAGNIVLREFDAQMNGRGIICVRYIDDFILLGATQHKVHSAYASAKAKLREFGLSVYELDDSTALKSGKVASGNIHDGTDVLGYRVSGRSLQPSSAACNKLLRRIKEVAKDCKHEMRLAALGGTASHDALYHQTMVLIHRIAWGWSQAFRHTTAKQVFVSLDNAIDAIVADLRREAIRLSIANPTATRRVTGIHLLADTPFHPLPALPVSAETVAAQFHRGRAA